MIYFDPDEPGWFSCSGTLLDADTFLTAGHCTFGIGSTAPTAPAAARRHRRLGHLRRQTEVLAGWPARADFPDEARCTRRAGHWLDDPANGFTKGTAIPHPRLRRLRQLPGDLRRRCRRARRSRRGDQLRRARPGRRRRDDGRCDRPGPQHRAGRDGRLRHPGDPAPTPWTSTARYKSTSRIVEVNGNQASGGNLHTSNNPSDVGGKGGSCFGDSGGPCSSTTPTTSRRRLLRAESHLPRRRLLVAGRHRGLRVPRAIPLGRSLSAEHDSRTSSAVAVPPGARWCDLARRSAGRTSWSTCRSPRPR